MNTTPSHTDAPDSTARLSIVTGLRACAMETSSSQERRALFRLADQLQKGDSIEDVLDNDRFVSPYLREMVRAGIKHGKMGRVLEEYLSSSQESRSIWAELYASLAYPIIILTLTFFIMNGLLVVLVPGFKSIFMDFGVELPGITMLLISLSDILFEFWWIILFALACIPVLWLAHLHAPGRAVRDRLIQRIPIIGTALKMAASAEFCSRLALLVECQIPLHEAMYCLSKSLRDANLSEVSESLSYKLEKGNDVREISRGVPNMLPALSSLFRWARDPELFAEGLRASSQMFAAQARVRAEQFSVFVEPLTVIIIATGAGFVVTALFMPLIRLLNELS